MDHGWFGARQVFPLLVNGKFIARHYWSSEGLVLGMFDDGNLNELTIGVRKVLYLEVFDLGRSYDESFVVNQV